VEFLAKGLRDAQLTLETQEAFRGFRKTGNRSEFDEALKRLKTFRQSLEKDYVVNLSYVSFQENLTWGGQD
tara:strand:- start:578 stop:790 length:213 start_codon:yes stop_codon:yes gene_type:complete